MVQDSLICAYSRYTRQVTHAVIEGQDLKVSNKRKRLIPFSNERSGETGGASLEYQHRSVTTSNVFSATIILSLSQVGVGEIISVEGMIAAL